MGFLLPFDMIPEVRSRLEDEQLLKETKKARKTKMGSSDADVIEQIIQDINNTPVLAQRKELFKVIMDYDELEDYINKANAYGMVAYDTETTGLNPLDLQIIGFSMYFPYEPAIYVPINHISYMTGERIEGQLTEEQCGELLRKLTAKILMHNAPFDIRVSLHTLKVRLYCFWDTQNGAILLGEEGDHSLKGWHGKHITHTEEKDFRDLFGNFDFRKVPIKYATIYAANDAQDTWECYEFQIKFINDDPNNREDRRGLYYVMTKIEMPMVDVIVALEENGVAIDKDFLDTLSKKYHNKLETALSSCHAALDTIRDKIDDFKFRHPRCKLEDPINLSSPNQLQILFYDILGCKSVEGKPPRSVDEDVLDKLKGDYPEIIEMLVKYRKALKLISTYIDNIYDIIDENGRIHARFKSNGAVTGRMSSNGPNLQNIPSHGESEEIRKMYIGQTTYRDVEMRSDDVYVFDIAEEIQLKSGEWTWVEKLKKGDILEDDSEVLAVQVKGFKVGVKVKTND